MSEEALRQQIQNLKKHNARLKRLAHLWSLSPESRASRPSAG
jgi:hypothetical protein